MSGAQPTYRIRDDGLAWREVADEIVVLNMDTSQYLTLNETGAVLWAELAQRAVTVEQLVDKLAQEFDVQPEVARRDVEEFLDSCRSQNLLEQAG